MNLVHCLLGTPLQWDVPQTIVLVVEHPTQLHRWVGQLYAQCKGAEGDWVATHNNKSLKFNKDVLCWVQYFDMTDTEKRLHSKLIDRLVHIAYDEDMYLDTHAMLAAIQQYLQALLDNADSNMLLGHLDLGALLKAANLQWDTPDSLLEKLVQYVDAIVTLTDIRLLVVVGLYAYLPAPQLAQFWHHCTMHDMCVLAIEATQPIRIADEKILVVDKDLCEFFVK